MPLQTSSAWSSCRSFTRRSRSCKYGVATLSIAFQAASEGSTYPPGRGPASKSSRSSPCRATKTSAATSTRDTVARSALAARLASEMRSGRDDRRFLRTICASSPVRTSRQSYLARVVRGFERLVLLVGTHVSSHADARGRREVCLQVVVREDLPNLSDELRHIRLPGRV